MIIIYHIYLIKKIIKNLCIHNIINIYIHNIASVLFEQNNNLISLLVVFVLSYIYQQF